MNIKNLIILAFVAFAGLFVGCEQYRNVPAPVVRVPVMRPYAWFNRNEGVYIPDQPFTPGQRNHKDGPCTAYDFEVSVTTVSIDVEVKMDDSINVPATFSLSYKIIPEMSVDLALNYMPADLIDFGEDGLSDDNGDVQVVKVPLEAIYQRNIAKAFDMVARDVMDEYRSKDINQGEMGKRVHERLIAVLSERKIPRTVLVDGMPVFDPKQKISIIDVIDIQTVAMVGYTNPESVTNSINAIQEKKAEISTAREILRQQKIEAENRELQARYDRTVAVKTRESLAKNPNVLVLERLRNFKKIAEATTENNSTSIIFVPQSLIDSGALRMDLSTHGGSSTSDDDKVVKSEAPKPVQQVHRPPPQGQWVTPDQM